MNLWLTQKPCKEPVGRASRPAGGTMVGAQCAPYGNFRGGAVGLGFATPGPLSTKKDHNRR
jgi:hypothetical protein